MSNKSNNQGRAYEFAWIEILNQALSEFGATKIIKNSGLESNRRAWQKISYDRQEIYKISVLSTIKTVFELEPRMIELENDELTLEFQKDGSGIKGDVRDIVIKRKKLDWEIGLSIKHNHDAVKHSRLSHKIDFGSEWFGKSCSDEYWNAVNPIFDRLKALKAAKLRWSDIDNKDESVYIPLLQAFMNEIFKSYREDKSIPRKMIEYLIGIKDYYKIVSRDDKQLTLIRTFNMHGTLNKPGKVISAITVPKISLPTELVALKFKNNSKNTIEMYLNNGWQLSFRIHNASTKVEPSLKFDIQFIGMPPSVISIECHWKR